MRTLKILLVLVLVVVAVAFGITEIRERTSGKSDGPKISCAQETMEISVRDDESVLLTGVTAVDRQDGDLTGRILVAGVSKLITDDTARVSYLVFDSDDNVGSLSRYVRYTDYQRPRFQVSEPLVYAGTGSVQLLDRITATDSVDAPEVINESIRVSSLWPTEDSNVYSVTVQVTNSLGDTARVSLPVILWESDGNRPEILLKEQLVYLDQGTAFDARSYIASVTAPNGTPTARDVEIDSQVNVTEPGNYWVYYTYSGGGSQALAILTVVVQ